MTLEEEVEAKDGPFQRLLRGEQEPLHVSVSIGDTNASAECEDGVYAITTADWRVICEGIARERTAMDKMAPRYAWNKDGSPVTAEDVARMVDEQGMNNRWFRLSQTVAEWLNNTRPVVTVVAHIG